MPNSNNSSVPSNDQTRLDAWTAWSRRHPEDAYAWIMAHRRQRGQPLRHLPPLADLARDDHPFIVVKKSAQVGVTELGVNLALWAAATGYAGRGHVLFCMPHQNQMDDFAQARFDQAIQDSPALQRLRPAARGRRGADRMRLKQLGPGQIFLRGADNPKQIASVDADWVILDEYDQMAPETLARAQPRLTSSRAGRLWVASTPRFPEAGIDALYRQSDQRRYYLPCAACGEEQPLTFRDNVDPERLAIVCRHCRAPLDPLAAGRWVAEAPAHTDAHGYHLSILYSPWCDLERLVARSQAYTPHAVQEFHNSDLGETFSPPGGGLSLDELDRNRADYDLTDYAGQPCVMGVDVGLRYHVVVRQALAARGGAPLWFAGALESLDEVEGLLERFRVQRCVIDAQPETHTTAVFARRHPDIVRLARYGRQDPGHVAQEPAGPVPYTYHCNRTEALDATLDDFRHGCSYLPKDARLLGGLVRDGYGEYYRELLAPQRTLVSDAEGNLRARWEDHGRDDHFAHAEVYAWLAEAVREPPRYTAAFAIL